MKNNDITFDWPFCLLFSFESFQVHFLNAMMHYDKRLLLKAPLDYDVKKIGFVLVESSSEEEEEVPPTNPKTFCFICDRDYIFRSNLSRHQETIHHVTTCFECEICELEGISTRFETLWKLSKHQKVHQLRLRKSKFECELCGCEEQTEIDLEQHMKSHEF